MHWIGREFGVLGLAVLAARPVIYGQEVQRIVDQAVRTELAADGSDHSRWMYFEAVSYTHLTLPTTPYV